MSDVVNFTELAEQGAELLPPRILLQIGSSVELFGDNLGDSLGGLGGPPEVSPPPPPDNTPSVTCPELDLGLN